MRRLQVTTVKSVRRATHNALVLAGNRNARRAGTRRENQADKRWPRLVSCDGEDFSPAIHPAGGTRHVARLGASTLSAGAKLRSAPPVGELTELLLHLGFSALGNGHGSVGLQFLRFFPAWSGLEV